METITRAQLIDMVKGIKSSFVSVTTDTDQSIFNKKDKFTKEPMMESIGYDVEKFRKNTQMVCLIGTGVTYEDMVTHRLAKENPNTDTSVVFEASSLPWGSWVVGAEKLLIEHEGETYIRVYCVANNKPHVDYLYEGKLIDTDQPKFAPFRKPEKKEAPNQGLDKPIVVRTYKLTSLKTISLNGTTYEIV